MKPLTTFKKIFISSIVVILIPSTDFINGQPPMISLLQIDMNESARRVSHSQFEIKAATLNTTDNQEIDIESEISYAQRITVPENNIPTHIEPDYWTTLHSIESKQGKLLYRPSNHRKNCKTTASPCGHHQLSLQALKDISCSSNICMNDRENFTKSLAMSKQLQTINTRRLVKAGYTDLPDYQKYLIHQQGAAGLKVILSVSQGNKVLSQQIQNNMARNSPFSYKKLKILGSKLAATKFLQHWEKKWQNEKSLVITSNTPNKQTEDIVELPLFNAYELQIALNLKI